MNQVVPNSNNTEFIAIINPIAAAGDQTIRVQAEDYAGNPLQSNPALIPIRQANGTWSAGVQPGIDANHYFKTGTFVCTNSGNMEEELHQTPQSLHLAYTLIFLFRKQQR